jgi:hypothetical protein
MRDPTAGESWWGGRGGKVCLRWRVVRRLGMVVLCAGGKWSACVRVELQVGLSKSTCGCASPDCSRYEFLEAIGEGNEVGRGEGIRKWPSTLYLGGWPAVDWAKPVKNGPCHGALSDLTQDPKRPS